MALRANECIFMGYDPTSTDFRNYHSKTRRIIISKDVQFDEASFPFIKHADKDYYCNSPTWLAGLAHSNKRTNLRARAHKREPKPNWAAQTRASSHGSRRRSQNTQFHRYKRSTSSCVLHRTTQFTSVTKDWFTYSKANSSEWFLHPDPTSSRYITLGSYPTVHISSKTTCSTTNTTRCQIVCNSEGMYQ